MEDKYDIGKENIKKWLSEGKETTPSEEELTQMEDAFIAFARAHSQPPSDRLRSRVLDKIGKLNRQKKQLQHFDLQHLPLLDENTNWMDWEYAVRDIEAPEDFENIYLYPLESNENRDLFLIWVKEFVEEEVHHELLESFLILEGSCECYITNQAGQTRIVRMGQGDFITMQLEEKHDILITSLQPAKAILQWRKLAA